MICDRFDVVALPFPIGAAAPSGRRPALVLSTRILNLAQGHTLFAMITSAETTGWATDITIADLDEAGLPAPSVVRLKLFTLENGVPLSRLGTLAKKDAKAVRRALREALGEDG
ncbi:MAG: type II toxin-antitoxin system PemK/MazF family toxin [Alphaproteobacteria bacterium]|nr:type II toxin-antitoxin system PemK/MazF family toxin [Alphaproteobacteria bacterium]